MPNEYPNLWNRGLIQACVRQRANHQCEGCGMEFHQGTNIAKTATRRDGYPMVGTVHHINHIKWDCRMVNLVFLCQSCHWTLHLYDWKPGSPLLRKWHGNPPQWILERGIDYMPHYQLLLFELEV